MIYSIIILIFVLLLLYTVNRYDRYLEKKIKEWEKNE